MTGLNERLTKVWTESTWRERIGGIALAIFMPVAMWAYIVLAWAVQS